MNSMAQITGCSFERIEKKFWMTAAQYEQLIPILDKYMVRDNYGVSTICNIYYDTPDYALVRRSIERPLFKEKLRLRSYGMMTDDKPVFVEIKRKLNGIGYKRRISVPFKQAKLLLQGKPVNSGNPQIEKELLEFVRRYHPKPMVLLAYRRFAMYGKEDHQFRVTIDRDLKYRIENVDSPDESGLKPIMNNDSLVLMEIKAGGAIPLWLTDQMSRLKICQTPFSKIGTCYTYHIAPNKQKIG